MFYHGYIFQTMLAEAGPLNDGAVRQNRAMQLIYGVNKPFEIRLNSQWHKVRFCLLEENVPHYINGDGDWQFCFYIYPDSHTGYLLKSTILKKSPVSVFSNEVMSSSLDILPSAVRPVKPFDLKRIFEQIIYIFTGRMSSPRPDQPLLRELRRFLSDGVLPTSEGLAEACRMDQWDLADQFKRITEFNLETWLMHQRMMRFFEILDQQSSPDNFELDRLAREQGIGGTDALDRLFSDFFGITYTRWTGLNPGTVILWDKQPEFPCFM